MLRLFIFVFCALGVNPALILAQNETTKTTILLIRHGETDWNLEVRLQGSTDNPLNATGIAQAAQLSEKMLKYHPDISSTVYSSDLQRAMDTGIMTLNKFILAGIYLNPLTTMSELREFDWGPLEGMVVSEKDKKYKEYIERIQIDYPLRKHRWNYPLAPEEGVESLNQLVERTKKAIYAIAIDHPGEKVAVFVHGRVINTLIIDLEELETDNIPGLPNCAVVHFSYDPEDTKPLQFVKIENLLEAL